MGWVGGSSFFSALFFFWKENFEDRDVFFFFPDFLSKSNRLCSVFFFSLGGGVILFLFVVFVDFYRGQDFFCVCGVFVAIYIEYVLSSFLMVLF